MCHNVIFVDLRTDQQQDEETLDDVEDHRENLGCRQDDDEPEDGAGDDKTAEHNDQLGRRPA